MQTVTHRQQDEKTYSYDEIQTSIPYVLELKIQYNHYTWGSFLKEEKNLPRNARDSFDNTLLHHAVTAIQEPQKCRLLTVASPFDASNAGKLVKKGEDAFVRCENKLYHIINFPKDIIKEIKVTGDTLKKFDNDLIPNNHRMLSEPELLQIQSIIGSCGRISQTEFITSIVENDPAILSARNDANATPLQWAVAEGAQPHLIKLLLELHDRYESQNEAVKAVANIVNKKNLVDLAIKYSRPAIVKYLLNELIPESKEPLTADQLSLIDDLLFKTIKQIIKPREGITQQDQENNDKILNSLLEYNSRVSFTSDHRKAALLFAIKNQSLQLALFLMNGYKNPKQSQQLYNKAIIATMQNKDFYSTIIIILMEANEGQSNSLLDCSEQEIPYLATLLNAMRKKLGSQRAIKIIKDIKSNAQISPLYLTKLICVALELSAQEPESKEETNYEKFFTILKQNTTIDESNWSAVNQQITALIAAHRNKEPKKSIAETREAFEKSPQVKFPLPSHELDTIDRQYETIIKYGDQLVGSLNVDLLEKQNKCIAILKNESSDDHLKEAAKLELLAILKERTIQFLEIQPNTTQMFTLLGLLNNNGKGRSDQSPTGDGKSVIEMMLEAYERLTGIRKSGQPVINESTFTPDLAEREVQKTTSFFSSLSLTVANMEEIGNEVLIDCEAAPNSDKIDIAIGIPSDFRFYALTAKEKDLPDRPNDIHVVDESDGLILDNRTSLVKSFSNHARPLQLIKSIWSFVNEEKNKELNEDTLEPLLVNHLAASLDIYPRKKDIKKWLSSALAARDKYKEGTDYIVKDGYIAIFSKVAGQVHQKNVSWGNFLHGFLELKHALEVSGESIKESEIDHQFYLTDCTKLYNLTATAGLLEERKVQRSEMKDEKENVHFDSPPHFPSQNIKLDPIVCTSKEEHENKILEIIKAMNDAGRPVLMICETIKETEYFKHLIETKLNKTCQLYNDKQSKDEVDSILNNAGKPGAITIGTYKASRGTDVINKIEALEMGGLYTFAISMAPNGRIELQIFGRPGRYGQPGSHQLIVLDEEGLAAFLEKLKNRDANTLKILNIRNNVYKINRIFYMAQKMYLNLPSPIYLSFKDVWIDCFTRMKEITQKYIDQINWDTTDDQIRELEKNAWDEICKELTTFWNESNIGSQLRGQPTLLNYIESIMGKESELHVHLSQVTSKQQALEEKHSLTDTPELFVADMDKTLTAIHTYGFALSDNAAVLRANFKNSEKIKQYLIDISKKMKIGIATFGTEIELQTADGKTLTPLFKSGKASIEAHFKALLGDNWKETINSIQAFETKDNGESVTKVVYQVSKRKYKELKKWVESTKEALEQHTKYLEENEKNLSYDIKILIIQKIQNEYDNIHTQLSQLPIIKNETARPLENILSNGKNQHIAKIKIECQLTNLHPSKISFADDDPSNRLMATIMGCQVVRYVCSFDQGHWLKHIIKSMAHVVAPVLAPILAPSESARHSTQPSPKRPAIARDKTAATPSHTWTWGDILGMGLTLLGTIAAGILVASNPFTATAGVGYYISSYVTAVGNSYLAGACASALSYFVTSFLVQKIRLIANCLFACCCGNQSTPMTPRRQTPTRSTYVDLASDTGLGLKLAAGSSQPSLNSSSAGKPTRASSHSAHAFPEKTPYNHGNSSQGLRGLRVKSL